MDLRNKTVLVTGGAVRLGRAMTLALAEAGANVVINYRRSAEDARRTAVEARAVGARALAIQADVGEPDDVAHMVNEVEAMFGGVDILVNSAAPFVRAGLQETTLETWRMVLRVLLDGPFMLAQAFGPGMLARGEGVIVNILDLGAFQPMPAYLAHSVGKSGLLGLTRNLAVTLAPSVRVNAIVPGPVLPTPKSTPAQNERIAQHTLLRRWGTPKDVVKALLYLVGADYVTGEVLFVDGGEAWKR